MPVEQFRFKLPSCTAIDFSARLDSPTEPGGILYQVIPRNKPLLENEVIVVEAIDVGNSQSYQESLAGNIQEDEEIQAIKETIETGNAPKTWTDRYLVQDGLKPRRKYMGEDHHNLSLNSSTRFLLRLGERLSEPRRKEIKGWIRIGRKQNLA